jgi:hypothetical protein
LPLVLAVAFDAIDAAVNDKSPLVEETPAATVRAPATVSVTVPAPFADTGLSTDKSPAMTTIRILPSPAAVDTPEPPIDRPFVSSSTISPLVLFVACSDAADKSTSFEEVPIPVAADSNTRAPEAFATISTAVSPASRIEPLVEATTTADVVAFVVESPVSVISPVALTVIVPEPALIVVPMSNVIAPPPVVSASAVTDTLPLPLDTSPAAPNVTFPYAPSVIAPPEELTAAFTARSWLAKFAFSDTLLGPPAVTAEPTVMPPPVVFVRLIEPAVVDRPFVAVKFTPAMTLPIVTPLVFTIVRVPLANAARLSTSLLFASAMLPPPARTPRVPAVIVAEPDSETPPPVDSRRTVWPLAEMLSVIVRLPPTTSSSEPPAVRPVTAGVKTPSAVTVPKSSVSTSRIANAPVVVAASVSTSFPAVGKLIPPLPARRPSALATTVLPAVCVIEPAASFVCRRKVPVPRAMFSASEMLPAPTTNVASSSEVVTPTPPAPSDRPSASKKSIAPPTFAVSVVTLFVVEAAST